MRIMFDALVGIIVIIVLVAAFLSGGTMGFIYALAGCLGFGALFEIFGFWD